MLVQHQKFASTSAWQPICRLNVGAGQYWLGRCCSAYQRVEHPDCLAYLLAMQQVALGLLLLTAMVEVTL